MAEVGCLKDGSFQNLEVRGRADLTNATLISKRPTQTVTDLEASGGITAINLTTAGEITLVPALTGGTHTLELPPAATCVGCTWTFVAIATVGQDFDVTTNGSEKILGAVPKGDGDNVAASDANNSCGFDANAIIGSRFSITCVSSTAGIAFIAIFWMALRKMRFNLSRVMVFLY